MFGPRRSEKNTPAPRSSDSESNLRAVKTVSRQVTAVVVPKHSGRREYLAGCERLSCGSSGLREHVSMYAVPRPQTGVNRTGNHFLEVSSIAQFSFFSSPSMAKSKPPTAQELYRQRRQREEEEKYAYLPPGLINHGNTCFMNSVLQGVRFFIFTLLLGALLITLVY